MITLHGARYTALLAACMVAAIGLAAGCESQPKDSVSVQDIRNDLSPNFNTVIYSEDQVKNNWAITQNLNERQLRDDWNRIWFLERPQRLTPYPIPY